MRVLVTGGAGFIGSHLAEAFVARGDQVTVVDDLSTGKLENLPAGAAFHELDIRSPEAAEIVRQERPELLVHHAAQMNVRRSVEDVRFDAEVNILGTLNLLEAARQAGVAKVLFASSGGAIYGDDVELPTPESASARPLSPYGVAKLAGERYLDYYHAAYGLDVTCLRYANVYGPRQNALGEAGVVAIFCRCLLDGTPATINGDGLQTRDYVYIEDVVAANLAAADRTSGFQIFNVGTGVESTVLDIHRHLAATLDSAATVTHAPAKPGEQRRSATDSTRAQTELDLGAPVALEDGLRRTAEWFQIAS